MTAQDLPEQGSQACVHDRAPSENKQINNGYDIVKFKPELRVSSGVPYVLGAELGFRLITRYNLWEPIYQILTVQL